MRIIEVDTVYTGERLKVPMRIDVDSATWLNNRQKPTKGTWKWATENVDVEHYKYNVIDIKKIKV